MLPGTRVAVDGVNGIAGCGSVEVGTWHQRSYMCVWKPAERLHRRTRSFSNKSVPQCCSRCHASRRLAAGSLLLFLNMCSMVMG